MTCEKLSRHQQGSWTSDIVYARATRCKLSNGPDTLVPCLRLLYDQDCNLLHCVSQVLHPGKLCKCSLHAAMHRYMH